MDYPVKTPDQLRPLLMGFRTAAGLTQAQMAARLGVTQQTYAQLEARPESASMARLFKALRLLKVQIVLAHPTGAALPGGKLSRPAAALSPPLAKRVQPAVRKRPVKSTAGSVSPAPGAAPEKPVRSGSPKPREPARAAIGGVGSRARKREDW
ncbi:helix-turn-helix transcriptional regulator [Paraburkholderia fungorum]|uniref:helix-turn-helix transcriptional regulator n=1 Tax=Paraburkholderia fungorum TaxID=134537 RepID=UPI0038BCA4F3